MLEFYYFKLQFEYIHITKKYIFNKKDKDKNIILSNNKRVLNVNILFLEKGIVEKFMMYTMNLYKV